MCSVGKSRGHSIVLHRRVSHEHAPSPEHAQPRSHGNQLTAPFLNVGVEIKAMMGEQKKNSRLGIRVKISTPITEKGIKLEIKFSVLTVTQGWVFQLLKWICLMTKTD